MWQCGVKAPGILYLLRIGCKSLNRAMASLSCGGPLKCLRIMRKKATAWRMNQSIEPVLSVTSSLPFFLFLVQFSFLSLPPSLPIFSSFASRSVLSWNIYSAPGPASLNRHTNSPLNIAQFSLHAFPSVSGPQNTEIGHSHPLTLEPRRPIKPARLITGCSEENGHQQEMHPRAP